MAIQPLPAPITYPILSVNGFSVGSTTALTLDAIGEGYAVVDVAWEDTVVRSIGFSISSIPTMIALAVGIQTVGTDGNPSGTWMGSAGDSGELSTPGSYWVDLPSEVRIPKGTAYAACVMYDDGSGTMTRNDSCQRSSQFPGTRFNTGSWFSGVGVPLIAISEHSGWPDRPWAYSGRYAGSRWKGDSTSGSLSASNHGMSFVLPFRCSVSGVIVCRVRKASNSFDLDLDAPDGSTLASITGMSSSYAAAGGSPRYQCHYFADPVICEAAETPYTVTLTATSGTETVGEYARPASGTSPSLPNMAIAATQFPELHASARTYSGSTYPGEVMGMGVIIDGLDDGVYTLPTGYRRRGSVFVPDDEYKVTLPPIPRQVR